MNWYKKSKKIDKQLEKIKDHFKKVLGLGKYKPDPKDFKKPKKKRDGECLHSLDMHCDGTDDGY